jgi:hypothetical protein
MRTEKVIKEVADETLGKEENQHNKEYSLLVKMNSAGSCLKLFPLLPY